MEYASIYRRFRPDTFDKVIGQKHIVRTLTNQIKSGKISHAYLFTGTRGTGKTSCAKIFARAINCLSPIDGSPCNKCSACLSSLNGGIDIIEMDAASNNGVDEIRLLKENAMFLPTESKYKVYIIDEVHMLTASAFNALLKILEEPPKHVVFILATTEVQKLPQTILSRCIRFDFRLIELDELVELLKRIFNELEVTYDERALSKIALQGEGSVRDTLSVADTCISYCNGNITYQDALELLCATDFSLLDRLATAILDGDIATALDLSDNLLRNGRNGIARELANYYNTLITVKNVKNRIPLGLTENEYKVYQLRSQEYSNYRISRVMEIMAGMENQLRFATQPRILLEANVVKACNLTTDVDVDSVINRVKELEEKVKSLEINGIKAVPTQPTPIIEEIKEVKTIKEVKETKEVKIDKPVKKTAISEEMMAKIAKRVEEQEELLFEETEQDSGDVALAQEIWSRVKEKLNTLNEYMLNMICESIDDGVKISGNEFILIAPDSATHSALNSKERKETLTKIIRETANRDYVFVCLEPTKKGISQESKERLFKMFNGNVTFKGQ